MGFESSLLSIFFSKGRGNSCVSTIFLEEADCQGWMGEAEGGKGVKNRKIKAQVYLNDPFVFISFLSGYC